MFAQYSPASKQLESAKIVQVKCEKTGTIYYKNVKTGKTAWRVETLVKKS